MNYRKPQYLTKQGFSRSGKGGGRSVRRIIKPLVASTRYGKTAKKGLSEEAARQIASLIKKMLKSP